MRLYKYFMFTFDTKNFFFFLVTYYNFFREKLGVVFVANKVRETAMVWACGEKSVDAPVRR